ncbi:MAG TPA: 50S ribosomal protein L3 N(5)-glutamine methyltransferase [Steroidobacteraceae bacterium]
MAEQDTGALAEQLVTLGDLLRFAVTAFESAGLTYGHGTHDAVAEASFLLLESLRLPQDRLELFLDARLLLPERFQCIDLIQRRVSTRKPAPYLVGRAYIGGVPFQVDERVIVPRSFIAHMLQSDLVRGGEGALVEDPTTVTRVLDLCTGSACIAIIAAMTFRNARVDAVELSPQAFEVARANIAARPEKDRIRLLAGSLFEPVAGERYDLIVTNPPYVAAAAMATLPEEYRHEPRMALAGGEDGLDIVRTILQEAPSHLVPGGGLLCEIGSGREILEREFPDLRFRWLADDACFFVRYET